MNHSQRIQLYLDGRMTDEEQEAFLLELKKNPELQQELDLHRFVDKALDMKQEEAFRKRLETAYQLYVGDEQSVSGGKRNGLRAVLLISVPAAAIITILLYLFMPADVETGDDIYQRYYSTWDPELVTRGKNGEKPTDLLDSGIVYFARGQYLRSKDCVSDFHPASNSDSMMAMFYLGMANLELELFSQAEICLMAVDRNDLPFLDEHCSWYLGLTLLQNQKKDTAAMIFTELLESEGVYSRRAKEILTKIN